MCDKVILENGRTLMFVPNGCCCCYFCCCSRKKPKKKHKKAVDNYACA